jgi:hypothetical protein
MLALAAERAIERVLGITAAAVADLAHLVLVLFRDAGRSSGRTPILQSKAEIRHRQQTGLLQRTVHEHTSETWQ